MRKTTKLFFLFFAVFIILFPSLNFFNASGLSYGNYDAAIIIKEDGSIVGANVTFISENHYALTGDISLLNQYYPAGIQILKDNIELDGSNHILNTNNSAWIGIDITDRKGVKINNFEIQGFKIGIKLDNSSENFIDNNTISGFIGNQPYGVPTGIWLSLSSNNVISSNNVTSNIAYGILISAASLGNNVIENKVANNGVGIDIDYCPNNVLRDNQLMNNEKSLKLGYNDYNQFIQEIDTSNTVDGKPTIYWLNKNDSFVPSNAGFVALGNCNNITVKGLFIKHTYDSITLIATNNSEISDNQVGNCGNGVFLNRCQNVRITRNNITGNSDSGIGTTVCNNITIDYNNVSFCNYGITPAGVTSNHVGNGGSANLKILNNNITNCLPGIYFSSSSDSIISQNNFSKNDYGVNLILSSNNNFTQNNFIENTGGALRISDAYNNTFYHNNFINNNLPSQILTRWFLSEPYETNIWDNGKEGNYWSNFQSRYPNSSRNSDIWSTPFVIDEANIDHRPLVSVQEFVNDEPVKIIPTLTPSSSSPTEVSAPAHLSPIVYVIISVCISLIAILFILLFRRHRKTKLTV